MPAAGTSPKPACFFRHRIFVLHHFLLPSRSSCALHAETHRGLLRTPFSWNFPISLEADPSAVVGMLIKPARGHAGRHKPRVGKRPGRAILSLSPHRTLHRARLCSKGGRKIKFLWDKAPAPARRLTAAR